MKSRHSTQQVILFVKVYQGPAIQSESEFSLNTLKEIRIGKSSHADLSIPFAPFPNDLHLFQVTKWGARIRLDPRFDGFVSDGQRFGSVRDFIAPRGALKELATILEPLEVAIPEGSRGALEIAGYTIVFRVAKPKPVSRVSAVKGAPKAPFALPYGQTAFEKAGFFLGMVSSILVTVPCVTWMNKMPIDRFGDIKNLPPFFAAEIIHPDHFQILPWAFGTEFNASTISGQAVHWVDELRKKWQSEESGRVYESTVPVLRGVSVPEDFVARRKNWQRSFDDEWKNVGEKRESAAQGTFVSGQAAYAPFRVVVAGGDKGSIVERVRASLERLDKAQEAAISLIETEHSYMKSYFKQQNAEIAEIFDPPREAGLFFRLSEKAFHDEKENFHLAESFSAIAREKQQKNLMDGNAGRAEQADPLIWSGESLVLASVLNMPSQPYLSGSEEQLFKNAMLSVGTIPPPPKPKPVAKIDMNEVESFVRSRSPEVKLCYDQALNRNPRLGGSIFWKWTISEDGKLARSKVERSTIKDSLFLSCLDKKMKGWTFPRPVNGAITISFPFRFVVREKLDTLERISR